MDKLNNHRKKKHEGIRLKDEAKLEEKSSEEVTISNEEIEIWSFFSPMLKDIILGMKFVLSYEERTWKAER